MLSPNQIDSLIRSEQYATLIRRILENGRCTSQTVERMLIQTEVAAVCGLGFALQRLSELAYCRSASADRIAARLLALQRHDGLFGHPCRPMPGASMAATAVALRGLEAWRDLQPLSNTALERAVSRAIDRGVAALARGFLEGQCIDRDTAACWAIVLWQLGDSVSIRGMPDLEQLRETVAAHATDHEFEDVTRLALAVAA